MHVPTNVSPLEPQAVPDQSKDESLTHEKVLDSLEETDLCVLEAEGFCSSCFRQDTWEASGPHRVGSWGRLMLPFHDSNSLNLSFTRSPSVREDGVCAGEMGS